MSIESLEEVNSKRNYSPEHFTLFRYFLYNGVYGKGIAKTTSTRTVPR